MTTTGVLFLDYDRVFDLVAQERQAARQRGEKEPGRPALVKRLKPLGAKPSHIRAAVDTLNGQPTGRPPATASQPLTLAPAPASGGTDSPPVPAQRAAPWRLTGDLADGRGHQLAWQPPAAASQPATWRQPAPPVPPIWHPAPTRPAPAAKKDRLWPLVVIGLAAAVAIWSGWVGLGGMTGFGPMQLLPGIWDDLKLNTAVVLPISLEAYSAFALRVWLTGTYSARTTRLAKRSALGALAVGGSAQIVYHLLAAGGYTIAPWPVTMLVPCVPVAVLALAASLAHLVRQDRRAGASQ